MKNKPFFFAFFSLLFLQFYLKFPRSDYINIDSDAIVYPDFASSIVDFGSITYALTPLSYFGKYPFSVCSGFPVIISSIMVVSGLSLNSSIIIFSQNLAIMSILGPFILSKLITNNNFISLVAALCFSIQEYNLMYTFNNMHFRGFILCFFPFFMWFLLKSINERVWKYYILTFVTLIILTAIHRLSSFVFPAIFLPLIFYYIINRFVDIKRFNIKYPTTNYIFLFTVCFLLFLSVYFTDVFNIFGNFLNKSRMVNVIRIDVGPFNPLFGVANYYTSTGLLQIFSLIGIIYLIFHPGKTTNEVFLLFLLLSHAVLLVDGKYFTPIALPTISIFSGIGVYYLFVKPRDKRYLKFRRICLILIIVFSVSFSTHMSNLRMDNDSKNYYSSNNISGVGLHVPDEAYNAGIWRTDNIASKDRIILNNANGLNLGYSGNSIETTSDYHLMRTNDTTWIDTMNIELAPTFEILLNVLNQSNYYGGNSLYADGDIYKSNYGTYYILWLTPEYKTYMDNFEVRYAFFSKIDESYYSEGEGTLAPFFTKAYEDNYIIYNNEYIDIFYCSL